MLYKKLDKASADAFDEAMDVFSTPETRVSSEKAYEREYQTLNPLNSLPYHFKINTGNAFMMPLCTRINTTWTMRKKDVATSTTWTNITKDDMITVENGFGSMFGSNLRIKFNGVRVFDANNLYALKVALDNELQYTKEAKQSSMNCFGYYYDNSGYEGGYGGPPNNHMSKAFEERRALFENGKYAEFSSPIYADVFQQPRCLPSGLEIEIEIDRHDPKVLVFAPQYSGTIELTLVDIRLYATFVDLHPGFVLDFERRLANEPFRIPLRRSELKAIYLEPGCREAHHTVFPDYVPRQLTITTLAKPNYHGNMKKSFLHFDHEGKLQELEIDAGGVKIPNSKWRFDFPNGKYVRGFEHLHRTIGLNGQGIDCGITRKMFLNGYCIWPFNTTPSQTDSDAFDFVRVGPSAVNIYFKDEITEGHYLIVYGEWDAMMFIDATRTVRTDLTV